MTELLDLVSQPLLQRSLIACVLVSVACSVLGVFVVLRGLAFLGDGLSHATLAGVAAATLLGIPGLIGAYVVCLGFAFCVERISRASRLREDTAIGILFSVAMAIGLLLFGLIPGRRPELLAFLFGSVLTVSITDLVSMALCVAVVCGLILLFLKELIAVSFDEELSEASGLPVTALRLLILALLALTIVTAIRVSGVLLVSSLIVIPAATALQLCDRFTGVLVLAALVGVSASIVGLVAAVALNLPVGAAITLAATTMFALSVLVKARRLRAAALDL